MTTIEAAYRGNNRRSPSCRRTGRACTGWPCPRWSRVAYAASLYWMIRWSTVRCAAASRHARVATTPGPWSGPVFWWCARRWNRLRAWLTRSKTNSTLCLTTCLISSTRTYTTWIRGGSTSWVSPLWTWNWSTTISGKKIFTFVPSFLVMSQFTPARPVQLESWDLLQIEFPSHPLRSVYYCMQLVKKNVFWYRTSRVYLIYIKRKTLDRQTSIRFWIDC